LPGKDAGSGERQTRRRQQLRRAKGFNRLPALAKPGLTWQQGESANDDAAIGMRQGTRGVQALAQ
jgi:hypothetical protein